MIKGIVFVEELAMSIMARLKKYQCAIVHSVVKPKALPLLQLAQLSLLNFRL